MELLTRDEFRSKVFERDRHRCVICGAPGKDAHHIMERRLFDDGGYYLENGATLCGTCHLLAEATDISPEEIREAAGIKEVCLPAHLYDDERYDKWGNIILPGGARCKGELFGDESVRKILGDKVSLFTSRVRYPRTYHLPWSPGVNKDDRQLKDTRHFEGRNVVVTLKMDGENTSLYRDYIHARSLNATSHPSRAWVKRLHGEIAYEIPEGWRLCGENLYARHTLPYDDLPSFFLLFSVWDDNNVCLSWAETKEWAELLGLEPVPMLYEGPWDEALIRNLGKSLDLSKNEGYVVRVEDSFPYGAFRKSVAKFVRPEHVGTGHNWLRERIVPNKLRPKEG